MRVNNSLLSLSAFVLIKLCGACAVSTSAAEETEAGLIANLAQLDFGREVYYIAPRGDENAQSVVRIKCLNVVVITKHVTCFQLRLLERYATVPVVSLDEEGTLLLPSGKNCSNQVERPEKRTEPDRYLDQIIRILV